MHKSCPGDPKVKVREGMAVELTARPLRGAEGGKEGAKLLDGGGWLLSRTDIGRATTMWEGSMRRQRTDGGTGC